MNFQEVKGGLKYLVGSMEIWQDEGMTHAEADVLRQELDSITTQNILTKERLEESTRMEKIGAGCIIDRFSILTALSVAKSDIVSDVQAKFFEETSVEVWLVRGEALFMDSSISVLTAFKRDSLKTVYCNTCEKTIFFPKDKAPKDEKVGQCETCKSEFEEIDMLERMYLFISRAIVWPARAQGNLKLKDDRDMALARCETNLENGMGTEKRRVIMEGLLEKFIGLKMVNERKS